MLTSTKYDIEIFSYKGYYRWKFHISSFINYILYILCKNKTLSKFFQNIKKLEKRIKCINNQTYLNVDKITKNEEMQVEEKIQKIFRQIGRI